MASISFPPFQVDVRAAELRKYGVKIRLAKQPFQVLLMLLQRPGEVVLRSQIQSALWPGGTIVEFDHSINAAIKNIRRVLADSAESPCFIETVGRQGYRFIGQLESRSAPPQSIPQSDSSDRTASELAAPNCVVPANFRVLRKLGEGAVGQVYLAQDLKLDRLVALKFLSLPPEALSAQMIERFRREARAAAALSHPNVCTVYGVEERAGRPIIVMEFVEGESLAARLERGPLPLAQALAVAAQVAAALGEAHRRGIVHRDLKPANIMLGRSGAKVLDFGLAKMEHAALLEGRPQTLHGTILGTPNYMSPEQARGMEADSRSDLFSFGAVLYEMITGRQAFDGSPQTAQLVAFLKSRAPSTAALAPPALDRLLQRCLAADPEDRWQSALDLTAELEWIANLADEAAGPPVHRDLGHHSLALAIVLLAAVLAFAATRWNRPPALMPRLKVRLDVPVGGPAMNPAISPDGSSIALGTPEGIRVRLIDSVDWQLIAGTEGARNPKWSPDSRSLIYYLLKEAEIKRVDLAGGAPRTIVRDLLGWRGIAWSADGTILFSTGDGPMSKISANGGTPVPATSISGYYPEMLPDGRHFLYLNPDQQTIQAGSLDSREMRKVTTGNSQALFMPPDHILFLRGATLMVQPFDPRALRITGEASPLAEGVWIDPTKDYADFSASRNGTIIYRTGSLLRTALTWMDRSGTPLGVVDDAHTYFDVATAPDGQRIAASRTDPTTLRNGIWVIDPARGVSMRVTSESETANDPDWSPDGRKIAYSDGLNSYIRVADGSGKQILAASGAGTPRWSPDGRNLVCERGSREAGRGALLIFMAGEPKPALYLDGILSQPAFSPDGRWLAYVAWEHEQVEVFVESVPAGHGKWQISTDGGAQPIWRRDGTELFYKSRTGKIMAVPVKIGSSFSAGPPKALFSLAGFGRFEYRRQYGVSPDGQRFLVNVLVPDSPPTFLLENWLGPGR